MKKQDLFYNLALLPIDFVAISVAAWLAFYLRFNTDFLQFLHPQGHEIAVPSYILVVAVMAVVYIAVMALAGLYSLESNRRLYREMYRIGLSISAGTLGLILYVFFGRDIDASRFLILAGWAGSIIFVVLARSVMRLVQRALLARGIGVLPIVLIGKNDLTATLSQGYSEHLDWGERVVADLPEESVENLLQQLAHLYNSERIAGVILATQKYSASEMLKIRNWCFSKHISFRYAPNLLEIQVRNLTPSTVAGIPLIELQETKLQGWGHVAKRLIDLIGASLGIIITSPLLILTALAVKIDSPRGPIIYKNLRINHKGEEFAVYKFRSMKPEFCVGVNYGRKDAVEYEKQLIEKQSGRKGPLYKIQNDPRWTRIAPFIRKTSLDELPQLFNVLFGSLSLVGPRPHQEREIAKYSEHHKRVFAVKPGLTGLPQISGRSDLDFEDEVRLDTYYIENWSLFLDLRILFLTPFTLLKSRKTV